MERLSVAQFTPETSPEYGGEAFSRVGQFHGALADAPPPPMLRDFGRENYAQFAEASDEWDATHGAVLNRIGTSLYPRAQQPEGAPEVVRAEIAKPARLQEFDPRYLHGTQSGITREGLRSYLTGEYERTGETYADRGNMANQYPFVVMDRSAGRNILAYGHHRAHAALLRGQPLLARTAAV